MKAFNNLACVTLVAAFLAPTLGSVLPIHPGQATHHQSHHGSQFIDGNNVKLEFNNGIGSFTSQSRSGTPEHHAQSQGFVQPELPAQLYSVPPQKVQEPTPVVVESYQAQQADQSQEGQQAQGSVIDFTLPQVNQGTWNREKTYKFGYSSAEASRQEESDDEGNVVGSYTLLGVDGEPFEVRYKAGAELGFVIENTDEVRRRTTPTEDSSALVAEAVVQKYNQINYAPAQKVQEPAPAVVKSYQAQQAEQSQEGQQAQGSVIDFTLPQVNQGTWNREKTYKFGYSSAEASRQEESDNEGNVVGSYTLLGVDGQPIEVQYKAGSETGYVVQNSDEVRRRTTPTEDSSAPIAEAVVQKYNQINYTPAQKVQEPTPVVAESYQAQQADQSQEGQQAQGSVIDFTLPQVNQGTWNREKTYKFGYSSAEASRQEESDDEGNIVGSYTLLGVDGEPFEIRYKAGAELGFVIENTDEVRRRTTPTEDSSAPIAKASVKSYNQPQQNAQAVHIQQQQHSPKYASAQTTQQAHQSGFQGMSKTQQSSSVLLQNADQTAEDESYKPYSFEYQGQAGSRQEYADESGNVKGEYSYTGADGKLISVQYKAGPETGFVIENEEELQQSLKESSQALSQREQLTKTQNQVPTSQYQAQQSQESYAHQQNQQQVAYAQTQSNQEQTEKAVQSGSDEEEEESYKPYAFQYELDSGSRKEEADGSGNVSGEYSYISADGKTIRVQYKAGPETGFVIENEEEIQQALAQSSQQSNQQQSHFKTQGLNSQVRSQNQQQTAGNAPQQQGGFSYNVQVGGNGQQQLAYPQLPSEQTLSQKQSAFQQAYAKAPQTQQYAQQPLNRNEQQESINQNAQDEVDEKIEYNPYSFQYQGVESSRQEESDESGKVRGQYSYINAEGNTILVQYSAAADTGFVIENEEELALSLTKATQEGAQAAAAAKTEQHQAQAVKKQSASTLSGFNQYVQQSQAAPVGAASPAYSVQTSIGAQQQVSTQKHTPQAHAYAQAQAPSQTQLPQAHTYAQAQAPTLSAASLLREGPVRRKVIIRKRRPVVDNTAQNFNNFPQSNEATAYTSQANHPQQQPQQAEVDYDYEDAQVGTPSAFSFAYQANEHSQAEETDEQGERFGSYQYVTPEGTRVEVKYRAGRNGFEILN